MRKGRETLLTLLEAFVYDPLVDWTITNESGYTGSFNRDTLTRSQKAQRKRRLELEITLGMFAIRVAEIKTDWLNNRFVVYFYWWLNNRRGEYFTGGLARDI